MNVPAMIAGFALLALPSAAVAAAPACMPTIDQAWVRAAPPGATMLAGYATVRNPCDQALAITGVSSADFVMGMIHETVVVNGVSKMRHARSLPLPAKGELRFAPGGRHLMLMHPRRALKEGDKVKLVLRLADGRRISADFSIRKDPPK